MNSEDRGHDNLGNTISELSNSQIDQMSTEQNVQNTTNYIGNINCNDDESEIKGRIKRKLGIGTDLFVILILLLMLGFVELGVLPHRKAEFYCDDKMISHKNLGSTISTLVLIFTGIIPFFMIWATEIFFNLNHKNLNESTKTIKKTLFITISIFREYIIGMLLKLFLVECLKTVVGELRPHFLDTCKPDAAINCIPGTLIKNYECTNTHDIFFTVADASKSFPSGHSSVSTFESIFMIWYLQVRTKKFDSKLFIPFIQTLLILWTGVCSVSRIYDYMHFWWDVITGIIIGVIFACYTCIILCKNFKIYPYPYDTDENKLYQQQNHTVISKENYSLKHVVISV